MSIHDQLFFEGMLLITVLVMIAPVLISDWRKQWRRYKDLKTAYLKANTEIDDDWDITIGDGLE